MCPRRAHRDPPIKNENTSFSLTPRWLARTPPSTLWQRIVYILAPLWYFDLCYWMATTWSRHFGRAVLAGIPRVEFVCCTCGVVLLMIFLCWAASSLSFYLFLWPSVLFWLILVPFWDDLFFSSSGSIIHTWRQICTSFPVLLFMWIPWKFRGGKTWVCLGFFPPSLHPVLPSSPPRFFLPFLFPCYLLPPLLHLGSDSLYPQTLSLRNRLSFAVRWEGWRGGKAGWRGVYWESGRMCGCSRKELYVKCEPLFYFTESPGNRHGVTMAKVHSFQWIAASSSSIRLSSPPASAPSYPRHHYRHYVHHNHRYQTPALSQKPTCK